MNQCYLRVTGDNFDPNEYLRNTNFEGATTFIKGEVPEHRKRESKTSGFSCFVGEGDIDGQIEYAKLFLQRHKSDLLKLSIATGISSKHLDFGFTCRLNDTSVIVQTDYLPSELLSLAGELQLGILLSQTHCSS